MSNSTANSSGPSRQSNRLGKASREQIVAAAEQVLEQAGYHAFSTRKVAEVCGISVGNLTYHFPSKAKLVEAVVTAVCDRYARQRPSLTAKQGDSAETYLRRLVRFMLDDAVDSDTSGLFLELWVMARHHTFCAEILEQFYATVVGWITESLEHYFPNAKSEQREQAAYFLLTLSEGTVAVFSRSGGGVVHPGEVIDYAVRGVVAMLEP